MNDPLIDEIREIRLKISEKFDNSSILYIEHLIELQNSHPEKYYFEESENIDNNSKWFFCTLLL